MTSIDLNALRGAWAASGRRVDAHLAMDMDAMRALLATRTRRAFRRHSRWLLAATVLAVVVSAGLVAFIAAHWGRWMYVLLASLILPLSVAFAIVDVRQLRALARLSFDHPTLALRAELDALQARQVAVAKWEILLSVLLWFPVLIVPLKGLFGVDILAGLAPSVIWVNLLLGVVFVPVGLLVSRWMKSRWGSTPAMRQLLIDMAGGSWARARAAYDTLEMGEATTVPADVIARINTLRRYLLATAWLLGSLLGAIGLFNVMHGQQPQLIAAGVALIMTIAPQLAITTIHRRALTNFGDDLHQLQQRIDAMARVRAAYARTTLIALPALILPLAMVIAEVGADIDLYRLIGLAGTIVWTLAGVVGSVVAAITLPRATAFPYRLVNTFSFGTLARMRRLVPSPDRRDDVA